MPSLFLFLWLSGEDAIEKGVKGGALAVGDTVLMMAIVVIGWLLGSGPVSIIRNGLSRRRDQHSQANAAPPVEPATGFLEGDWPPPPNSRP